MSYLENRDDHRSMENGYLIVKIRIPPKVLIRGPVPISFFATKKKTRTRREKLPRRIRECGYEKIGLI